MGDDGFFGGDVRGKGKGRGRFGRGGLGFWWEEGGIGGFDVELCIISCNENGLVMRE